MSGSCLHGQPTGWHCDACERRKKRAIRIDPRSALLEQQAARIAILEAQLAAMPTLEQMQAYQRESIGAITALMCWVREDCKTAAEKVQGRFYAIYPLIKQPPAREEPTP